MIEAIGIAAGSYLAIGVALGIKRAFSKDMRRDESYDYAHDGVSSLGERRAVVILSSAIAWPAWIRR